MDVELFHVKRSEAEKEIRDILNALAAEFECELNIELSCIDVTAMGDKPKFVNAIYIKGVL